MSGHDDRPADETGQRTSGSVLESAGYARRWLRIETLHRAGASGPEVCERLSALVDELVNALAAGPLDEALSAPGALILAAGGYGRRELSPHSDVDLVLLLPEPPDDAVGRGVDALVRALWDRGFHVSLAARDLKACRALREEDLFGATALLTARPIRGDTAALGGLRATLADALSGSRGQAFLGRLAETMAARHQRYGGSVYLLEPNLKHSPGGLRDLALILWAAIVRYAVEGWPDLLTRGISTPVEAAELVAARAFMLRVRNALHYSTEHGTDRLTFECQESVAQALGFGDGRDGAERFAATWYQHAAAVKRRARLMLERCMDPGGPRAEASRHPVDACFHLVDGEVAVDDPRLFEREPRQLVHLFAVSRRCGAPISGFTRERAIEAVAALDGSADAAWRTDPRVVADFLAVLCEPEDPCGALGEMHETGVLGALIPEFGAVTHRAQHDLYHVHTVDIHALRAIAQLKALHLGELADREPLLTRAMARVERPLTLYVALLLHDVGKALGRGHAVKGAALVPAVSRRLALPRAQAREVEWLVRDHLAMAHLSQRRDLSDETLVRQFARQVGNEEALTRLYILTWADAVTTGPQACTDWKRVLLDQLFVRAGDRMRRGLDLYEDPRRRVARLRRAVSRALDARGEREITDVADEVDGFFSSLPTPYFRMTRARNIKRHIELLHRLRDEPPAVFEVVERPRRGYTVVHIAAEDRPGLLSRLAGLLSGHGFDIIGSEVHSTSDGKALDLFLVRAPGGRLPEADSPCWNRFGEDLVRVVEGDLDVEERLAPHRERSAGSPFPAPPGVETRVAPDQAASETCTVIDVQAPDRVGLLHAMTRAIAGAGALIRLARVTTSGDAAHDTFYVCDASDRKLDPAAAEALCEALASALEEGLMR